jgi:hypothetical protein
MDIEPTESVVSSTIFGGLNQSVTVYKDRLVIKNPISTSSVLDAKEVRYEQISDVNLYVGTFYATLNLSCGGFRTMVRWLPKGKATRIANLIKERTRAARRMREEQ